MLHHRLPRAGLPALVALLLSSAVAQAWPLGSYLYTNRWPVPPSYYGYALDETNPGHYGGGRYREYYGYGRGYGLADHPGPVPPSLVETGGYRTHRLPP